MDDACDAKFNRSDWAAAYQNTVEFPEGFWLSSSGTVPEELEGTLFRNGPGLFKHGGVSLAHPFDGHGLVASISFRNGAAFFRSSFISTREYQDEAAAQKILYKGTFGTRVPGGWRQNLLQIAPRNPANTGLLLWAGKLLALFEAGQPHRLCPQTLETAGVDLLGGVIWGGAPFSTGWQVLDCICGFFLNLMGVGRNLPGGMRLGGQAVCAHPVEDASLGRLLLFTCCVQLCLLAHTFSFLGWKVSLWLPGLATHLTVREFDKDFRQVALTEEKLPGYSFLHDMSATPEHYIFFLNPVSLWMLPLLLGSKGPAQCIQWREQPPEILCIRRPVPAVGGKSCFRSSQEAGEKVAQHRSSGGARRRKAEGSCSDSVEDLNVALASGRCVQSGKAKDCAAAPHDALDQWRATPEDSLAVAGNCAARVEPAFVFHQANAFRSADGRVVVDCVRYPRMPTFGQPEGQTYADWVEPEKQPISQLWRYTLDLTTGFKSSRRLCARATEFPAVNPSYSESKVWASFHKFIGVGAMDFAFSILGREHRFLYAAAALHPSRNGPQQAVLKLDLKNGAQKLWQRDSRCYVGEPIFVPANARGAEDDGWLLCICYDARCHHSECVVLDARDMGEVATLGLQHALPHGLHGTWSADFYGPSP